MSDATAHPDNKLTVTYNGDERRFEDRPQELVGALLDQAKREFHAESQHTLSLFTEGGTELNDQQTLVDAGVKAGDLLVLRPSTVKGGT